MTFIDFPSLQVPVWHPTLIGLDLPLPPLIGIAEKRKNIFTCHKRQQE
jgi:hypothetical protein